MVGGLPTKRMVDTVGGVGSILVGVACGLIGWTDWHAGHNTWKAWPIVSAVLLLNGVAMLAVARRAAKKATTGG